MTAITASRGQRPHYRIEFDHSEQLIRTISTLTIDPVKSVLYHFIPWVGAYISNQQQIRPNDKVQSSLFPENIKKEILKKVDDLRIAAGIGRKVDLYTSLNYHCSSYGGFHSLSDPIVSVPAGYLTVPSRSVFSRLNPMIKAKDAHWIFSGDEISFFIAREMAEIKSDDTLLRVGVKVLFLAALFFLCVSPISIFYGTALMISAAALYSHSERMVQGKKDISGFEILSTHFGDRTRAFRAAHTALEKLRQQNIERRHENQLCHYYINDQGQNYLDVVNHSPLFRQQEIRDHFAKAALAQ